MANPLDCPVRTAVATRNRVCQSQHKAASGSNVPLRPTTEINQITLLIDRVSFSKRVTKGSLNNLDDHDEDNVNKNFCKYMHRLSWS